MLLSWLLPTNLRHESLQMFIQHQDLSLMANKIYHRILEYLGLKLV